MGTTGLETAFAALYTELVLPGELELEIVVERMIGRRRAVRTAGPANRARTPGQPVPGRSRRALRRRRRGLLQPLGELLLPRTDAPGQGAADARGGDRGVQGTDARARPGGFVTDATAYVLLEDGARFDGLACGAQGHAVGEIVFTTSMSGYQEAMTDPSYAGQLITFTYPQIGNYGVSDEAMESDRVHARAAIMRAAVDHDDAPASDPGLAQLAGQPGYSRRSPTSTRARSSATSATSGAMRGGVFPASARRATGARADRRRAGHGRPRPGQRGDPGATMTVVGRRPAADRHDRHRRQELDRPQPDRARRHRRAAPVHGDRRTICSQNDPDAIFLANGPGDPASLDYVVQTVRQLIGKRPVYGICLGHQLLCRAVGLETYKLPFGHHGANHPVKDLTTGVVEITSQNHGFAVLGPNGVEDDRRRRGGALGHRLRRRRAHPHQPVRPHGRRARPQGRPGRDGPVPPRGRPRTERRAPPVRPLRERDQACRVGTTSTRSC